VTVNQLLIIANIAIVLANVAFAELSQLQHRLLIATDSPLAQQIKDKAMVTIVRTASIAIALGMQFIGIALVVGA
jgi:hypothetical protein